jgi:DNA-nicking Smr family endonuclease
MSRRRQLSDEELALWSGLTRSIMPLRRRNKSGKLPTAGERPAVPVRSRTQAQALPAAKIPPLAPLDRRLKQRVARGRERIDARIDLHGMTQSEAHAALFDFLQRARADGARIALVVTGKGVGRGERDGATERGVLKRQVPNWLSLPQFRSLIVGFDDASVGHGGQGALYVRLRRQRDGGPKFND